MDRLAVNRRSFFNNGDILFRFIGISNIAIIMTIFLVVFILSSEGFKIFLRDGLNFILTSSWSGVKESYGILFALGGTLVTGLMAILIAMAISIGSSIAIVEVLPRRLKSVAGFFLDLAASVPTVIYGLWGLFVLSPFVFTIVGPPILEPIKSYLGYPGSLGTSLFTASILLAIMISPFAAAIIREALISVPRHIDEALHSLGLTKFEVAMLKLRYIRRSVLVASMVAYGRAVGETIAVSMVVGNVMNPEFWKILNPGYTIASLIADQYQNAESYYYMVPAIFGAALILFAIGLLVNTVVAIISRSGKYGE
ncbi:MAG: phosphate ABC transporter permease subunit PstC [Desulfurococcales archaeon]